jgi:hypothetical protein
MLEKLAQHTWKRNPNFFELNLEILVVVPKATGKHRHWPLTAFSAMHAQDDLPQYH